MRVRLARLPRLARVASSALLLAIAARRAITQTPPASVPRWCAKLPRPEYEKLERVPNPSPWFEVYRADPGVYAIYEPHQWQEIISWLIVGSKQALLFDTGMGMHDIRAVAASLTTLPIEVLNSHTHNDHVGDNWRFSTILGVDDPFTRKNEAGYSHAAVAHEVAPESFCGGPAGLDTAAYRVRPFHVTRRVGDGSRLDLGARTLEVMRIPGHAPDAIALFDRAHGLLFTGDTFYEGPIYIFGSGSDPAAFTRSAERLAALVPHLRKVLPAHNVAVSNPLLLLALRDAVRSVANGSARGVRDANVTRYVFGRFSLEYKQADLLPPEPPMPIDSVRDVPSPMLSRGDANATFPDPSTLDEMMRWTYSADLALREFAGDTTLRLSLDVGVPPGGAPSIANRQELLVTFDTAHDAERDRHVVTSVRVTRVSLASVPWPEVEYLPSNVEPVALVREDIGNGVRYDFPVGADLPDWWGAFRFRFPALHAAEYENISAGVAIDGDSRWSTLPPTAPSLDAPTSRVAIGDWSDATIQGRLVAALAELLGEHRTPRNADVRVSFEQNVGGARPIPVMIPVVVAAHVRLDFTPKTGTVANLVASIREWRSTVASGPGTLLFDVALHSSMAGEHHDPLPLAICRFSIGVTA